MHTLHARLKAACEADLGRQTPLSFPPRNEVDTFAADYFLYNLLRKEEPYIRKSDVPTSVLRDSLAKFADSEWRCRVMNICGRFYTPIVSDDREFFSEAIRLATRWISNTMCDVWPEWENAAYTSGASRNSSRSYSLACLKHVGLTERGNMSATASASALIATHIAPEFGPLWPYSRVDIVNDCRFDFVHKTAGSVRFMALQPEYNLLAQSCVGDSIRAGLLVQGIDLNDQTRNQVLAYEGSITRNIATVDLSNSSDNVALQHGRMFLSERVMDYLLATRVTHATVGGYSHKLNKIAPMGNGFIMELQTLIYAGLAHAVTELIGGEKSDIAVYGDDIVISTCCAIPLMDLLVYLGMEPNMTKSYYGDDPFRESCGKHYFAGRDVTPFYIKEMIWDTEKNRLNLQTAFRAINGLMYWQQRTGLNVSSAVKLIAKLIPKKDRLVVPSGYSIDSGLHFAVSGCTFPAMVKTDYGDHRISFASFAYPIQDIAERLGEECRYRDWLRQPPSPLIPDSIYAKLSKNAIRSFTCRTYISKLGRRYRSVPDVIRYVEFQHGGGLDRKSYSRVLDGENHLVMRVSRSANLGEIG